MALDILIYLTFPWHEPMLAPLVARLDGCARLTVVGRDRLRAHAAEAFDIVVVADSGAVRRLRPMFPRAVFVHVGHGLISKNQTAYHYGWPDYICLAGHDTAERLTARGHVPRRGFWITGLIQADALFRAEAPALSIEGARKTVLYAPTWNPTLSSAAMLGDRLVPLIRGDDDSIGIVIKPHPHIPVAAPDWIAAWREAAERHAHVRLVDPAADLVPALLGADLMVSDASSAIFHFLALDRPVVLIDNPDRLSDPRCYDPDGIEWRWRDLGAQVGDVAELAAAVRDGLDQPERRGPRRRHYRERLFGALTDGRAAERVATHIRALGAEIARQSRAAREGADVA